MHREDRFLRLALRGNAAFSTLSGAVALAAAGAVARWLGLADPVLVAGTGASLLVFAGFLLWLSTRPRLAPAIVVAVIAADVVWVAGTIPVLALGLLSTPGAWAAAAIADVVALFALLQWLGLRRMRRGAVARA